MLEVKNLYVSYGERDILKNISFSLSKGETLSIIGPSGCGKSTLLLSIANLKENTSGNISNNTNNGTIQYIVKSGDSLWGISKKYNVSISNIKSWNNLKSDIIYINQKLIIKK